MSIFRRIANLDQKFSWSFFGFLLAVILGALTIYTEFIKKNAPDLGFELLSNANVLDVNESVGNLDILYKGNSLNRNNQSLRIVVLRVLNSGDQAILTAYYDPEDPIGFRVLNGQIVERPKLLEASNLYLREHLKFAQFSPQEVKFSRVILEPGDFFIVKVLLLHGDSEEPKVLPVGKIAGVKKITLTRQDKADKSSVWQVTFAGGPVVQAARAISYSFMFFVAFAATAISSFAFADWFTKRRRSNVVRVFKEYNAPRLAEADEFFSIHSCKRAIPAL